ncbi:helix-turn-helix domain-containing protein [Streptomyces coeruleorubidus]|uniref:TetR/AcrR family transcriptional regulator n=1 Tax=Streptomyces coeruleorubidus TaxID=116188 RepID=UPI003406D598
MTSDPGLRQRKKMRTRQALIEGALRLFAEKGYDQTTVAEIAATADVATRTFFSYFDSKDDIVFFDDRSRLERAVEIIGERQPGEPVADLLRRVIDQSVFADTDSELARKVGPARTRLIASVPALQARELHLLFDIQLQLTEALHLACPELDLVETAAAVGSLVGAIKVVVAACQKRGDRPEQTYRAVQRATDIAIDGLNSLPRPA